MTDTAPALAVAEILKATGGVLLQGAAGGAVAASPRTPEP